MLYMLEVEDQNKVGEDLKNFLKIVLFNVLSFKFL